MSYKFVDAAQLDADLTTVAEAIRTKSGTSAKLAFPAGMASAISAISTGVELNFEVVGQTSAPASPSENLIWVNTDQKVPAWYFDEVQPKNMKEGEVWFQNRKNSPVVLNALKKNAITIRPLFAKQLVSGALVPRLARILQNGVWNSFDLLTLATEANGSPYNGGQGWKTGYRLNSSGAEVALDGMEVTGFFPAAYGDTVSLKNIEWNIQNESASQTYIWYYDSDFNPIAYAVAVDFRNGTAELPATAATDASGNLTKFPIDSTFFVKTVSGSLSDIAYLRINCKSISADSIITTSHPAG